MSKKPSVARVTVSLPPLVYRWANELCESKGFETNFSAYIADLIRRDQERHEERARESYPPHREQVVAVEEKKDETNGQVYPAKSDKGRKPRKLGSEAN